MRTISAILALGASVLILATAAQANVFDMGPGLTSVRFVHVGNPGNPGELSGAGAGGYGPDRICGEVDYTYSIGKYEITAGQYCEFLNAAARTDAYGLYSSSMGTSSYGCKIQRSGGAGAYTYTVAADWANRPVNYVSWGDAARFCNWLANGQLTGSQGAASTEDGSYYLHGAVADAQLMAVTRKPDARYVIPTEDEWYKAAYYDPDKPGGAGYWDYPTRSNAVPSNALINPDPGNNANFYVNNYTIGSPYYRTPVGEFENSESPYGAFDQGGNAWEWDETALSDTSRGLRGGWFGGKATGLAANGRSGNSPSYEHYGIGFRIALIPEPATLAFLALGGVGMLLRRWRLRG